ncbi:MAG: SDR family NAD(P)-dependent oxidoreductase [Propionibacteriaceae bacterium]|jgi:NAD(P)-dependent dehydrogenase (short-subunit alcohol dehydrogenase family)|nr:SDR family NAD(P)-dependent oxidoreductase [Propionibacteriaceae bacterium]
MRPIYSFEQYGKMRGVDIQIAAETPPFASLIDLTGKAAIVTGGARGLGFHIVNRLVEAGAKVLIADIATEFAEDAVAHFQGQGGTVEWTPCDVRSTDQIKATVAKAIELFGQIDILVNNAGVMGMEVLPQVTEEDWDDFVDVNAKGGVFFAQAVAAHMVDQGVKGRIVNISSNAVMPYASPYFGEELGYVASKAALIKASEVLAECLAPHGIVVTCLLPGGMRSPGAFLMKRSPDVPIDTTSRAPMAMNPDEVARVAFMMATDVAVFAAGAVISVDSAASLGHRL